MKPIHIVPLFSSAEISPLIIIAGDPLRVLNAARRYLTDWKIVSRVRSAYLVTGSYKGIKVSFATSGMGVPSARIYAFELGKFYRAKMIVRVGTCGSLTPKIKIGDVVWATSSCLVDCCEESEKCVEPKYPLTKEFMKVVQRNKVAITFGRVKSTNFFFPCYSSVHLKTESKNFQVVEMETYSIFETANFFNIPSSSLLVVSDSLTEVEEKEMSAREREKNVSLFKLALELIYEVAGKKFSSSQA